MTTYPATSDALAKAQDYKQNFMNLSLPRNQWWHDYSYTQNIRISVTWGKDNYFFVYVYWNYPVTFAEPEDIGWGEESFDDAFQNPDYNERFLTVDEIKPYKGWIFYYNPDTTLWETIQDADGPLWNESDFIAQRKVIKAMP